MTVLAPLRVRAALTVMATFCCLAAIPSSAGAAAGLQSTLQDHKAFTDSNLSGDGNDNMTLAKSLGISGIRAFAIWQNMVPPPDNTRCGNPPAQALSDPANYYNYGGLVAQFTRAKNASPRPISTTLTMDGPIPCWASLDRSDAGGPGTQHGCTAGSFKCTWRPDPVVYQKWVQGLVTVLGPLVDRWSPWNEPNLPEHLDGPGRTSLIYRHLWFTAFNVITHPTTGDPTRAFYFGETAFRPGTSAYTREQFCKTAYSSGDSAYPSCSSNPATVYADQLSFHSYVKASFYPRDNAAVLDEVDDVLTELQTANRAGAITATAEDEAGVHVCTPETVVPGDCEVGQFTEDRQADFLNCMQENAWKQPRLKLFGQYELQDPPDGIGGDFLTGLRRKNDEFDPETGERLPGAGDPRPSLNAFAQPIAVRRVDSDSIEVWGGYLKPPVPATLRFVGYTGSRSNPTIEYSKTVSLGTVGYFSETIDDPDAREGLKWMTIHPTNGAKSREANGGECQLHAPS